MKPSVLAPLMAAFILVRGSACLGSVTVYTSKTLWSSAVATGYATETFNNGPFGTYGSMTLSSGIAIIAPNHGFIPTTSLTWHDQIFKGSESTTFHFPSPIREFGGDWDLRSYWIGTPNPLRLTLDGTQVGQQIVDNGFFGVVSSTSFSNVVVTVGDPSTGYQNWDVDNVAYTPEVNGTALTATLLGCGCMRRALRRK